MHSPIRSSLVALGLWLAFSGAPTDSTQRGTTFSCSAEPGPISLSTEDPKKLYAHDFTMPMGRKYWSARYALFSQPGDSTTLSQGTGRMRVLPDDDGDFELLFEHDQPMGAPEIRRYMVWYRSVGSLPEFEGLAVDVARKQASASGLDLLLRARENDLEIEYRFVVSGDRGHFERLERRGTAPWQPRFRYELSR